MGNEINEISKVKAFSIVLGTISFLFGILKFISPFKDWYFIQINTSGLPQFTYPIGIGGEIVIGIVFFLPFLVSNISVRHKKNLLIFANASFIMMLLTASIVHLIPAVPASVLPLKIKPPVIPLILLVITFFNLINTIKKNRQL